MGESAGVPVAFPQLCFHIAFRKVNTGFIIYFQGSVALEEVSVFFMPEEWALLEPDQRALHREVMEQNWENVASLGKAGRYFCYCRLFPSILFFLLLLLPGLYGLTNG